VSHQPIENYGIIGDLHTAALVGTDGSIDWLCLSHFDSPSVFAAILDDQKGGRFKIAPAGDGVAESSSTARTQTSWPRRSLRRTGWATSWTTCRLLPRRAAPNKRAN
jgi:trehalase-like protein